MSHVLSRNYTGGVYYSSVFQFGKKRETKSQDAWYDEKGYDL